ncbi:SPOR domain-containing protein [Winogradskyella maritima]|uniref:SPOR domain-containing protein n=1 Tax=Winogradskyella maritima TaxID=1517766 RepID=A0ABV8AHR6_9FLAO|nr:SPOR domain-containing protein [Winogradskyella maritima]
MQLQTYISDLLYRYDCVTVPHFGAFLTNRVSARIHETTHTFYPPKKVLSFNEQLQNNDGLLCHYVADVQKVPYVVAVEKVSNYVKSLKSELVQGETVTFENIGALALNAEGKITFEPSQSINYLTDAFGLSHFTSKDVTREVLKQEAQQLEDKAPIAITPEKRGNSNWLKYAAAAVIVLGLTSFGAAKYYEGTIVDHNELAQQEANEQLEAKVQEATFVISNPLPAATLTVEKPKGNYHIVAGAFRIEENSKKKVKQLRDKGYKARTIGKNRYGLYEVVYESFEKRSEATRAMYKIRRESNREAWLLVRNLEN